ncbi:hypothetical protein GCM10027280_28050 [Micromonospora polyrhachis]|uniref:Transcriptional regulator with XRE-family HTH domain n=1 Tax=Micromonospora polyrhachis TaxID=1282883 RepID=A0A7W7SQX6_9ACTN|nr:DUF5753 domain-containing protein [Micromonospora polyrhachis]MBB4959323.1 transcriptional regulator with XRE-family HTH domain [Micromonospora polyrhachis]
MNHALRSAMIEAGETADSLAGKVGVDPKTAARWVTQDRIPHPRHRTAAAAVLGKDIGDIWPDVFKRREAAWFRPWAEIEREAVALRWYEPAWVPGLFQTEAYIRATIAGEMLSVEAVERFVASRLKRQAILRQDQPPLLIAVIDESVIWRLGEGDPMLRSAQIEHLVGRAELPHVELHVVPASAGLYPGLGGPFILAEMRDGARAVYADSQLAAHILDRAEDVATLASRWERIRSLALPGPASLALIKKVAASWMT